MCTIYVYDIILFLIYIHLFICMSIYIFTFGVKFCVSTSAFGFGSEKHAKEALSGVHRKYVNVQMVDFPLECYSTRGQS